MNIIKEEVIWTYETVWQRLYDKQLISRFQNIASEFHSTLIQQSINDVFCGCYKQLISFGSVENILSFDCFFLLIRFT